MRTISIAIVSIFAFAISAEAQNCTNSVFNSYQCNNGSSLSPTWSGGYRSNSGETWNRNSLGNGWNSSSGNSIRQNSFGNPVTSGGSTWSC